MKANTLKCFAGELTPEKAKLLKAKVFGVPNNIIAARAALTEEEKQDEGDDNEDNR